MSKRMRRRRRHFRHLNQFDRDRIEAMLRADHNQEEIADVIGVDSGTISREISKRKRKNGVYESTTAQHKANVKRSHSKYQGMRIEKYPELKKQIIAGLQDNHAPDEIAGRMRREKIFPRVGTNAIYKWLYSCWGQPWCHLLCTKRYHKKKQKKKPKREMIPDRISLKMRPQRGIHGEGDIFVSSKKSETQRSGAIVSVPDGKLLLGTMIENKKPASMAQAINKIKEGIAIDDMTLDNGIENRDHKDFGLPTYFCDPHSPWQKPHVENGIGLLRRWFIKKKTDLKNVTEDELQGYLHVLNSKWRKSLGYRSAYEIALERGIIQTKIPLPGIKIITEKVAFR